MPLLSHYGVPVSATDGLSRRAAADWAAFASVVDTDAMSQPVGSCVR